MVSPHPPSKQLPQETVSLILLSNPWSQFVLTKSNDWNIGKFGLGQRNKEKRTKE